MTTEGPYRTARPLNELIAPDRRKQRAVLLVIASMIGGAVLWQVTRSVLEPDAPPSPVTEVTPRVDKLTTEDIEKVVRSHAVSLKQACWSNRSDRQGTVRVLAKVTIEGNGSVSLIASSGPDSVANRCVEEQVSKWLFPAHREAEKTVDLPFVFTSE